MDTRRKGSGLEVAVRRLIAVGTCVALLCGAACETLDYYEDPGSQRDGAAVAECGIRLGHDDETTVVSADLAMDGWEIVESLATEVTDAWSTVLKTWGPCHFTLYESRERRGRSLTLGTALDHAVRIGRFGFRHGVDPADTWQARSLLIERPIEHEAERCEIRLGADGTAVSYFGDADRIPALDRVVSTRGANCRFTLHDAVELSPVRYQYLFPGIRGAMGTRFPVDSLAVESLPQEEGPCFTADSGLPDVTDGRCLPADSPMLLPADGGGDGDEDGIGDALEDWLAETFRPVLRNDSRNNTSADAVALYEVRAGEQPDTLVIAGYLLWERDGGYVDSLAGCAGDTHRGDVLAMEIVVRAVTEWGVTWYYPIRVVFWERRDGNAMPGAWTDGRPMDEDRNTGVSFEGTHPELFVSGGKHHPFVDTSFDEKDSPYSDWGCNDAVDGRGPVGEVAVSHEVPCEDGSAGCRAFHNVGSPDHPRLLSPADAWRDRPVFHDYDLWQDLYFCGGHEPAETAGERGCTATILRRKFAAGDV